MAPLGRRLGNCERPESGDERYLLSLRYALIFQPFGIKKRGGKIGKLLLKELTDAVY